MKHLFPTLSTAVSHFFRLLFEVKETCNTFPFSRNLHFLLFFSFCINTIDANPVFRIRQFVFPFLPSIGHYNSDRYGTPFFLALRFTLAAKPHIIIILLSKSYCSLILLLLYSRLLLYILASFVPIFIYIYIYIYILRLIIILFNSNVLLRFDRTIIFFQNRSYFI